MAVKKDNDLRTLGSETMDLINDHELPGVTLEMLDWWWKNMVDPEYYKLWHPEDHISIEWEVPPSRKDNVGAIHVAEERIGVIPAKKLRIKVVEPSTSPIRATYRTIRSTCVMDEDDKPITWIVHEYEPVPGGTRMRSTFRLATDAPAEFVNALRKHNKEEMGQFPKFLPGLYRKRNP